MNSKIERKGTGFVINVEGDIIPTYAYITYNPRCGRFDDFKRIGVKLFSTGVYAGDRGINQATGLRPFREGFWKSEEEFDFSEADGDFRLIVGESNPGEVYIIPRLMLEPPAWWEDRHPEAWSLNAQGVSAHCSFSSEVWLKACDKAMNAFNNWLAESGWDKYVIGWHIAAGNTEEFIRPLRFPGELLDYSEASRLAFGAFLKDKYHAVEQLNSAWHSHYDAFDDIKIPLPAMRKYALKGDLRDIEKELPVVDFYRFYSREVSSFAQKLVKKAKQITGGKQIMGIFYGNMTLCNVEHAHNDFARMMTDPDIDFAASPFAYTDLRGQGIHWGFQSAIECANLHGKPFFVEADVRTCLSRPISQVMRQADPLVNRAYDGPVWLGPQDINGSLGQMIKAFGDITTHGASMWWFDMFGGWYAHKDFMDMQRSAYPLYERIVNSTDVKQQASIAVFVDEDSFNCLTQDASNTALGLLQEQMTKIGSSGAMYHTYMLSDLPSVNPEAYRTAMLIFPAHMKESEKQALNAWRSGGRTVIQVFMPDYYGNGICSATGFKVCEHSGIIKLNAKYNDDVFMKYPVCIPDITVIPEYGDTVLASAEDGRPAVIMRRAADHQEILSIVPCLPNSLVRDIVLISGGHIYCFTGDCISANSKFIMIHAAHDGVKRIYLPRKGRLKDIFSNEMLEGNETYVEMNMKFGESRMFEIV